MREIKKPTVGAAGNGWESTSETLSHPHYTTSHELRKLKALGSRLLWELAEWHLDRCIPRSPNFRLHFWAYVHLICLEDKLHREVVS